MTSYTGILRNLQQLDRYLAKIPPQEKSTRFERLVCESVAEILHLPFYTKKKDDKLVPHRLVWQANNNHPSKTQKGLPDAIAYCYGFCLAIEATMKTGAKQWTQEFAQSLRHHKDLCRTLCKKRNEVLVLMICTQLHEDTYRSVKSVGREECTLIPVEISGLVKLLRTSKLALTIRHMDLRRFFVNVCEDMRESSNLDDFHKRLDVTLSKWQERTLALEKSPFIGLKSYEVMRGMRRGHIGVSEILEKLQRRRAVNEYFKIIGDKVTSVLIESSLLEQSLGFKVERTTEGEALFELVPREDFRGRGLRLIQAVMRIR